jgi:hypothetical protein
MAQEPPGILEYNCRKAYIVAGWFPSTCAFSSSVMAAHSGLPLAKYTFESES